MDGGEVDDALLFAEEVGGRVSFGAEAEHAVPAEPPGGGHGRDVGCAVDVLGGKEDDWSAEVEDGGFDCDVHKTKDEEGRARWHSVDCA